MTIQSSTRFAGLLAQYPFLTEKLPEVNEIFTLLKTPLVTGMVKKSTISEMSRRSGMDENTLISGIENLIAAHAESSPSVRS